MMSVALNGIMLSVALNRYEDCCNADCRYAERLGANFGISLTIICHQMSKYVLLFYDVKIENKWPLLSNSTCRVDKNKIKVRVILCIF